MIIRGFFVALGGMLMCAPAGAAITIYSDPDAFKAALSHYQEGTFDYDTGQTDNLPLGTPVRYGPIDFSGSALTARVDAIFYYNGARISGPSYLDTIRNPLPLRVQSSQRGLGLYLSSYIGGEGEISYDSRGLIGSIASPANQETSFFGIIDTEGPVDVTLSATSQGQDIAIAAYISAVPEPAAWSLLILGFGGIGAVARLRNTSRTLQSSNPLRPLPQNRNRTRRADDGQGVLSRNGGAGIVRTRRGRDDRSNYHDYAPSGTARQFLRKFVRQSHPRHAVHLFGG